MKVHLIRANDMTIGRFNNIGDYLSEFNGQINFVFEKEEIPENEEEIYESNPELIKHTLEDNSPRRKEEFDVFFNTCIDYRSQRNVSENELVILLTNQKNENNYFGYCSEDLKNVFIQCSNWDEILGEKLNDIFPIVYEICAWTLRFLIFKSERQMKGFIPPIRTGCVMDMCEQKSDFSFKIRTADIRMDVMQLIQKKKINPAYINQIIAVFEKVRKGVLFRDRVGITSGLSRLELRLFGNKMKFVLVDFADVILEFEILESIIYAIFLQLKEGIRLQNFDDEIEIIENTFSSLYITKSDDFINSKIQNYTSIEKSTLLIQNISRINKKLMKVIPSNIVSNYLIDGQSGENYCIKLDRDLVDLHIL